MDHVMIKLLGATIVLMHKTIRITNMCDWLQAIHCSYHKLEILHGTKLLRFTGFLAECRENCRGFVKLQYIFE